ncbi:uncharacterized protein LOC130127187 [Lampris incognitus]|uniref:uncharacterized protein LOC130127187 n=1 Tax=Lampris incognitus TaxID=2546036 RepID=UPI0024B53460|nr:uncharacterized protein LOC130127187 [Lampris incognitus]
MEKVRVNIVNLVKQHPDGIPLKKMAEFYNRKYHHNLTCSALGFKTLASLIESLDEELVVKGQQVFHKIHKAGGRARVCVGTGDGVGAGTSAVGTENSCPTTPVRTKFKSAKDPPPATQGDSPSTHINQLSHAFRGKDISTCITVVPSSSACRPASPVSLTSTPKPLEKLSQEQLYQRVLEVIQVHPCAARSMEQMQNFYYLHFGEILPLQQFVSLCDNLEEAPHTKGHGEADQLLVQGTAALKKNAAAQCLKMEPEGEQKSSTPSFSASLSDFPALGAEGMQTKSQKKKLRDEALKEKNAQVFVDYYHAQLRVAHGANMRAADLLEGENEDSKGRRRNNPLDMEAVNSLVEDVVRELAAEGELVTRERVISRVCMLMQVPSLEAGKIKSWTVPALRDLQYTIREINMFIEATEASTSICTLYELGQSLAALKDKRRYEELSLGPLCKLPLIHRMFKIDPNTKDDDIPQIETVDILKCLRLFRTKQRKPKVDLTEFMQHLADQYNCDSPYELGIRIQGLGLPIGTILKVNRKEHSFMDHGQMTIQRELEEEVQERMRKIKRSVMEPAQGPVLFSSIGSSELRKKYVSMTAGEAVLEIFMNAAEVFTSRMNKLVQDFLLQVSGDRLARALFQLAICGGSLAAPQDLVLKDKPSKRKERENPEDKPTVTLPSEATIKQYLKDNLSSYNSAVTLANIASLERKLIQNFQVKGFHSLEQGTFLEFLVKHIQLLQETVGSSVSLGGRGMDAQGSGFRPSRQDVIEFIKQCGVLTPTDSETLAQIEAALRVHYRVQDSRDLGFSLLQTVAAVVRCQMDMSGGGGPSQVYYESALFAQHSSSAVCESVGLLGELAQSQALASLLSCPLLEDLGQWSQWELVFKPFFGTLKDFIERNAANTDLAALEVSPGVLLRITTYTGDKFFSQAAMTLDPVGTAGHLVSIVVTDGITNTPTALLANHMESSLAAAVAKEDLSRAEEDVSCYNTVARFLLECLIRIPVRTCRALLPQVFLEPLSRVLGQAKSKAVLLGMARSDPRHLNYLHQLGILLGITEWTKDYHNKLTPPQSHDNLLNASVDKTKSNLEDSLSSSLSGLNLSEDENLEDATLDYGFNSPLLNHSQQANGEQEVEDEDDDEEQLYELKSLPNGEVYSPCEAQSETDGSHEDGQFEMADSDEDAASNQSENAETPQRTIIEDIRCEK